MDPTSGPPMLSDHEIDRVRHAAHSDPFAVLGPHADGDGRIWLRAMLPSATEVAVLEATSGELLGALTLRHPDGFYEGLLTAPERPDDYRLQVRWADGSSAI